MIDNDNMHYVEDLLIDIRELYYEDLVYKLRVKTMDNRIIDCNTLIHSPQKSSKLMHFYIFSIIYHHLTLHHQVQIS